MKKYIKMMLIFFLVSLITISSDFSKVSAHAPTYVDVKYYEDEHVLSVYYTHGVSDYDYHFIGTVIIEYYELLNSSYKQHNPELTVGEVLEHAQPNKTHEFVYTYHDQGTHQVFHVNYTDLPDAEDFTLINVTAICNLGGSYSNSIVVGNQPYYDPEHSMIEALVPTIICSVVTMTPLAIHRIVRKVKDDKKKKSGMKV